MLRKLLILSLCISVLFVFSALISPVNAGSKNVNWKVAGSIANYVMVFDTNSGGLIPYYLINLSAKGPPGPAEITLFGYSVPEEIPDETDDCDLKLIIQGNQMVARFDDLSLLFASHDEGYLCVHYGSGTEFDIEMNIIGGTGRFDGATGAINGTGFGHSVGNGPLSAETANIIGTIDLP